MADELLAAENFEHPNAALGASMRCAFWRAILAIENNYRICCTREALGAIGASIGKLLPQDSLQDLAGGIAREQVTDDQLLRHLEASQATAAMRGEHREIE